MHTCYKDSLSIALSQNKKYMKVYHLENAGGVDNLNLKEVAQPVASKNEVIIKAKSLSINPVDTKCRGLSLIHI